jgi:hypothetical protein
MSLHEDKDITLYEKTPSASLTILNEHLNTTKGRFTAENYTVFSLRFENSSYTEQNRAYSLVFDKKPYYFAYVHSEPFNRIVTSNIYVDNTTFYVANTQNCSISAYNHFDNITQECTFTYDPEPIEPLTIVETSASLNLTFMVLILILTIVVIFRLARSQFRKVAFVLLFVLFLIPFSFAEEDCGITNLASCIPQKIFEFLLVLINAPLIPLLEFIKSLFTAEISIDLFFHVWSIIRYILSFFYIFFFLYAGYAFLFSGGNPIKRMHAKEMLKDTFLMIVLIQGSFFIYGLLLSLSNIFTSSLMTLVPPDFFYLTIDNIVNLGLQILLALFYAITLIMTSIYLVIRYIIVIFGVVLFPIAIFCFFIPPIKAYGRFLLNVLGIFIFITIFDLLIILACSMIVQIPLFENFKIVVMITCFTIINYTLYLAIKFALTKAANSSIKDDFNQAVKYISLLI